VRERGGGVEVPRSDDTPPGGRISLHLPRGRLVARASQPGPGHEAVVRLRRPVLRGTMIGTDEESGTVRVRVSLKESITCASPGGARVVRAKVRYFPPSQIARATASPGARIPVTERRTRTLVLGTGRCPAGMVPTAVTGELWGDVTNGVGLEAVTPHIRLAWRR
jgi:hypothetical protein